MRGQTVSTAAPLVVSQGAPEAGSGVVEPCIFVLYAFGACTGRMLLRDTQLLDAGRTCSRIGGHGGRAGPRITNAGSA